MRKSIVRCSFLLLAAGAAPAQPKVAPDKEAAMKADLAGQIDAMKKQAQVMVDSVFSFGELGFQEFETTKYNKKKKEKGAHTPPRATPPAGRPRGGGESRSPPRGPDIDDIPQASQK